MVKKKKRCTKCGKTLFLGNFHRNKRNKDGRTEWCKPCKAKYAKGHWIENKERLQKKRRKHYAEHKIEIAAANAKRNKKRGWAYRIMSRYGITAKQYYIMLKAQSGGCWICGSIPKKRKLHIDHCHKSGEVRGLLCMRCNRGLAWFSDKPERLHKAAAYLEKAK